MNKALIRITLRGMARRWTASILLIAVCTMGVFAAMVLENLTLRQEQSLESTLQNTTVSCTVTNEQGTDSGNLRMHSSIVAELLEGELSQFVTNVQASGTLRLTKPEEGPYIQRMCRILNPQSVSIGSAPITYAEGYDETVFTGTEMVCVVSPELMTPDGELDVVLSELTAIRLKIVGVLGATQSGTIYVPLFMPYQPEGSIYFPLDRCTFDLRDARYLEESKNRLYQLFVVPALDNPKSDAYGLIVHDDILENALTEIRANLRMLKLLLPVLLVLCGAIGFFASFLAIRGRRREYAAMRCIGLSRWRVLGLVLLELGIFAALGAVLGIGLGAAVEGAVSPNALGKAAVLTGVFLVGSALAAWCVTGVNVMKLMKVED